MSITIKPISSKSDFKKFVQFQFDLYKGQAYWVPPIKKEEVKALLPASNPAFEFCDTQFWLAMKGGKIVGRIGAIINSLYLEKTGEKYCRLTRAEFIDDETVSKALFETAEQWAKDKGMNGVRGPLGFSNLDHQGMLIEGFDHLPSIASEYHMPYYKSHFEKMGYEKEMDWVEFRLKLADKIPEKAVRVNEIVKGRLGLKVKTSDTMDDLRPYGQKMFELLNSAFSDLFSVVPFNQKMIDYFVNRYFSFLNPRFIKIVLDQDQEVVGFIVGLPSLSEAMQKAKGKLFPFGFTHIKKALKNPEVVDLLLTAVKPELQSKGLSAVLITELQQTMMDHGVKYAETTGIIETNQKAIQHWKNYDHIQHKRKRCFKKDF